MVRITSISYDEQSDNCWARWRRLSQQGSKPALWRQEKDQRSLVDWPPINGEWLKGHLIYSPASLQQDRARSTFPSCGSFESTKYHDQPRYHIEAYANREIFSCPLHSRKYHWENTPSLTSWTALNYNFCHVTSASTNIVVDSQNWLE